MKALSNNKGFTLVELLIICPMLMAIIAFMMNYLFNQYGQLTVQNSRVNVQISAQAITYAMQDDVFFASAFTDTINSNLVDSYAPSGGWQASSSPTVFIISTPALTASHRSASRQPVYINTFGCGASITDNDALYNNIVYWVSGTNLYKRVISAPANMSTCGTSYQKQSCPAANATSSCPADNLMTDQLQSFTVSYFDTTGTQVSDPAQASEVKISVVLSAQAFSQTVTGNSSITLRKINQ